MKKGTFIKNFPFEEIRPQQKEALEKIEKYWDNYRYFIIEAPTGFGKSAFSGSIGMSVNNSFLITTTKQLQDQYIRDFKEPEVVSLKGKANYQCNLKPELNVECGPCTVNREILKECKKTNICSYYKQRKKALNSNIAVLSMPFFLFSTTCGGYWEKRDVIIIDECHTLESQLVQWATIKLSPVELFKNYDLKLPNYTPSSGYKSNQKWLYSVWELILEKRKEYKQEIEDSLDGVDLDDLNEDELEEILLSHSAYYNLDKLYKKVEIFFKSPNKENWICEPEEDGIILTPVDISDLFKRYIDKMASKKIIFMSATILDLIGYAKSLGLKREEVGILRLESDFPPENSPIYYRPSGSMNYNKLSETMPKIIEDVKEILSKHPNEKGIIHTGNYNIAKAICESIQDDRLLMREENENNESLIMKHISSSKPTVLVSPSLTTGTDLKDDLSRFQIIVKAPFLNLSDKRVKIKSEQNPDWYVAGMLRTFVQASGRSTRDKNDYSTTYILDSCFYHYILKYRKWLPNSFFKRIKWKKEN